MAKFVTFDNQLMLYTILVGKGQKKMHDHFNRCRKRIPQNPTFFQDKTLNKGGMKRNLLIATLSILS